MDSGLPHLLPATRPSDFKFREIEIFFVIDKSLHRLFSLRDHGRNRSNSFVHIHCDSCCGGRTFVSVS